MPPRSHAPLRVLQDRRPQPVLPSSVLGMLIFTVTEAMLFAGMMSAFAIVKAGNVGPWPPPGQPRLPVESTALNTAALLLSGAMLFWAWRRYRVERASARAPFAAAIGLGVFFVAFQGYEWVQLIGQGLTLTSSSLGNFFYLIVGVHALHAVAAIAALVYAFARLRRGMLNASTFITVQVFWYFVVGIWPVLYMQVYL